MASYTFETIGPLDALGLTETDSLSFTTGSATQASVRYLPDNTVIVAVGAHSVTFGAGLMRLSLVKDIGFPDGSILFVGDGASNTKDYSQLGDDVEMYGGAGDDNLHGGLARSVLQGNQGNDTLTGSGTIYGGQDNDVIHGSGFVQGNKGDDTIQGGFGADTLLGGQGADSIDGHGGSDVVHGDLGNDTVSGDGQVFGDAGDDVMWGGNLVDGGSGNDTITAGAHILGGDGDDRIMVNNAQQTIEGGAGNDHIEQTQGLGLIDGGDGNDYVDYFSDSAETIRGGAGDDTLSVNRGGHQVIDGGDGNDGIYLATRDGGCTVTGGAGNDTISGYPNSDATDSLSGGDGDDVLFGRENSTVDGGMGNDRLAGAVMAGGPGTDTFEMAIKGYAITDIASTPHVLDWSVEDRIAVSHMASGDLTNVAYAEHSATSFQDALDQMTGVIRGVSAFQIGADVLVVARTPDSQGTEVLLLVGRTLADIDLSNFL